MFDLNNVESVKKAIQVDFDYNDDVIMDVYVPNAINEVKTSVSLRVEDDPYFKDNPTFNLAVLNTVKHHNDNRSITSEVALTEIPSSSMKLIQTLRAGLAKWRAENIEVIPNELSEL